MILVELANSGQQSAAQKVVNISREQRRAEDLLEENRLYRQTALEQGDSALAGVLDELERVLLDVAHSPQQLTPVQLQGLRQRIETRNILFKVRVVGNELQERRDRGQEARDREQEKRDREQERLDRLTELYDEGGEALDEDRYERAEAKFGELAQTASSQADAALYWKAYAENRLGKRDTALANLAELKRRFPQSRWLKDASALELEVRQSSAQPIHPEAEKDEELRMLALRGIMNSDP